MKTEPASLARAATLLLAAAAPFATAALAQDNGTTAAPIIIAPAPAPTPAPTPPAAETPAPPQPQVTSPQPTSVTPPTADPAPEITAAETPPPRRQRTVARPAPRRATTAAPAASAETPAATPPPAAVAEALPAPVAAPAETLPSEMTEEGARAELAGLPLWAWLLAGVAAMATIAALLLRRRRRDDLEEPAYHEETAAAAPAVPPQPEPIASPEPQPGFAAAPVMVAPKTERPVPVAHRESIVSDPLRYVAAAPVLGAMATASTPATPDPVVETVAVEDADAGDVAALAAASTPQADGPWLELLMRPIRAGTNATDAVVEFELTVGNTGSAAAEDVRVSTWMFAAGTAQDSETGRLLIDPPAESRLGEMDIAAGDGAKLEATVALPRAGLDGSVLPVVVADARYTLPDGSEGRVSASFAVGLGEGVDPFPLDDGDGHLSEDIGARLHGELIRA